MKIELDQTVWVKPIGNNARRGMNTDAIEATVSKIGRKYFELTATDPDRLWSIKGYQFYLDNGLAKSDYSAGYQVYETKQKIEDERLCGLLRGKIMLFFGGYGKAGTLAQLIAIAEILEIEYQPINL